MSALLFTAVRAWIEDDPDPITAAELAAVLASARAGDATALHDLRDRFDGMLEFGTAGLRGRIGAGPNRMNRAVVQRAAAGLGAYLLERGVPPLRGERYRVVVGFDARHRSDDFAADTAAVLTAAGVDVALMPRPLPTPLLAWATRHLPADAGVMVTASHNPPQDNGYKVYLGGVDGGTLIVPPADSAIAERIAAVTSVAALPRADSGWRTLTDAELDGYYAGAAAVAPDGPRELRIVATPLHGVGGASLVEVLGRAGFTDVHLVAAQAEPDPDFPTVAFPNPEEAGAIDLAIATARERNADLVIATDPDADRCAVAVRDRLGPADSDGWRMLRGDELGCLLGEFVAGQRGAGAAAERRPDATLACSIVSSTLLGKIAAEHGLRSERTLTGFKWIARAQGIVFGYEEALGVCVAPDLVHDKDGLSAAVLAAHLAAVVKAQGRTLMDALDDLARRHGLHATDQLSLRVDDLGVRGVVLERVLATPPGMLGGLEVQGVDDLSDGVDGSAPTQGLRLRLPDGWVIVRPSGTEPKLKAYLEVVVPVSAEGVQAAGAGAQVAGAQVAGAQVAGAQGAVSRRAVDAARRSAAERLAALRDDLEAVLAVE